MLGNAHLQRFGTSPIEFHRKGVCIKFGVLRHTTAGQLPSETRNFRQTANFRHFCFMTFLGLFFLRIFRVLGDFRGFCIILKFFAAEAATYISFFKGFRPLRARLFSRFS